MWLKCLDFSTAGEIKARGKTGNEARNVKPVNKARYVIQIGILPVDMG